MSRHANRNEVYIVDGRRTPQLKAQGRPGPFQASDLAHAAARGLLLGVDIALDAIDEVILGCVAPGPDEANIGRVVALRLGLPERTPAWTVQRNCASGMQALDAAAESIRLGRSHLILAGGTEAMSHHPVLLSELMVAWLAEWSKARSLLARGRLLGQLSTRHLKPVIGLLRGLTVTLQDRTPELLGRAMGRAAKLFTRRLKDRYQVQAALDRLTPDHRGLGVPRADVVIEAIFEDAEAKRALYAELEPRMREDAVLATNTSSIPLAELRQDLARHLRGRRGQACPPRRLAPGSGTPRTPYRPAFLQPGGQDAAARDRA